MNNFVILLFFVPFLALVLLFLNVILAVHNPDAEKVSAYECGFLSIAGQTRSQFQIHFFLVALLFLVFDLEIVLLFPASVTLYQVSFYGFTIYILFLLILTIGFVLEIGAGAIKISSNVNPSN
jgi:NADH:ubiquinone oxidoreductase subunit 3 (subunit A)